MKSIHCPVVAQLLAAAAVTLPLTLARSVQTTCCYGDGRPCVCGSQGCSSSYCPPTQPCCYGDGTSCVCGTQGCSSSYCPSTNPCCYGDGTPCVCGSQGCSSSYCPTTQQCCYGNGTPCVCGSQGCSSSYCPTTDPCCYGDGQTCPLLPSNNVCPQNQGCSPTYCQNTPLPGRSEICSIQYTGESVWSNECCTCLYGSGSTCRFIAACQPTMQCSTTCVQFQFMAASRQGISFLRAFSAEEEKDMPPGYEFYALAREEASKVLSDFFCPVDDDGTQAMYANLPEAAMITLDADEDGNITCSEYTKAAPQLLETIQISTHAPKAGDDGTDVGSSAAAGLTPPIAVLIAMAVTGVSPKFISIF